MYIGPWQEYKLARLIQHQHQALAHESAREAVGRSGSRPSSQRGAEASPSSSRSGFSGFSSNSAPARLPGPSPQVRLKDYCDSVERLSKANDRRRWAPPRPRLPSGSSTGSTRPYSSSSRGSDRGPGLESCSSTSSVGNAAAKRAAGGARKASGKPPKAASFEEQRRARIRHMQRLYGLGQGAACPTPKRCRPTVVEPQNSQRGGEPTAVEASPVQRQPRQPRLHRCPSLSELDFILGLGDWSAWSKLL
ncbi:GRXC6 [Symbiodinium microadriaticum]|nr:GRXC6 [Symbiodinium microadriaticum]